MERDNNFDQLIVVMLFGDLINLPTFYAFDGLTQQRR